MRRLAGLAGALLAALVTGTIAAATVNVHVGSYYFEDGSVGDGKVVAKVGDQLRFLVDDNGGTKPHSVVITELGIDSGPLLAGSTYVTPVIDRPGTFSLFCRVHRVNFAHFTTLVVTGEAITPKPTAPPTPRVTPAPTPSRAAPTGGPSAGPVPTAGSGATPGPSSGVDQTPAPGVSPSPGGTPAPSDSAAPSEASPLPLESPGETLTPGVSGPPTRTWLRSVLVGGLILPGVSIVAAVAWLLANRRSRSAGRG